MNHTSWISTCCMGFLVQIEKLEKKKKKKKPAFIQLQASHKVLEIEKFRKE